MIKNFDEFLNESYKWTDDSTRVMSDMISMITNINNNTESSIAKNCPAIKNFSNFVDSKEKALLDTLKDKFSKATESSSKVQLTKDEKNLVQRIAVFAYKNAYTLNKEISNLYFEALNL